MLGTQVSPTKTADLIEMPWGADLCGRMHEIGGQGFISPVEGAFLLPIVNSRDYAKVGIQRCSLMPSLLWPLVTDPYWHKIGCKVCKLKKFVVTQYWSFVRGRVCLLLLMACSWIGSL